MLLSPEPIDVKWPKFQSKIGMKGSPWDYSCEQGLIDVKNKFMTQLNLTPTFTSNQINVKYMLKT